MKIQIDQSGKIESTNRKTVVAYSNGKSGAVVVSANDKKRIQKYFRSIGKPRLFSVITFVALVFLLIKDTINGDDQVMIDREYPGYEKLITSKIIELLNINGLGEVSVAIAEIGKKSPAHDLAWNELKLRVQKRATNVPYSKIIEVIKKSGSI